MSAGPPIFHSAGEHELPGDSGWLSRAEQERAATLRFAKRRNDYLLGRFTTKSAVAGVLGLPLDGCSLGRIEVRNRSHGDERGAPEVWIDDDPASVEISITDRAGWGVCVVTPPGPRLGCDLELVEPRSAAFVADYLTRSEQSFVAEAEDEIGHQLRANLVWSAKESVLKVLRTGLRRDTRSVEVDFSLDAGEEGFSEFRASTTEGGVYTGWWQRFGDFLLTYASQSPTQAPRPLVDPPSLRRARPSHSWLLDPSA